MFAALLRARRRARLCDTRFLPLFDEDDGDLVSLDCETSSLNPRTAELLSIGAVKIRGNRILAHDSLALLVKPQHAPEGSNIAIHGLRPRDLATGVAPEEAMTRLAAFIGARPLVGYYLEFDIAVLNHYLRPLAGIALPNRQIELSARYYDYRIRQYPDSSIDLSLSTLQTELGVPALPRHDALNDALSAAMLYLALRQRGFG
ncbi:3'-5' exonuclease [Paludibacterium yongneupense]|uniref:3'-5' exonuclease n=1 Tax=Paludibacterium yongneupense TaxID=400061 RepID=UPI00040E2896|nr:3'-5' exonuclease [Paludibacterium yongneupense]